MSAKPLQQWSLEDFLIWEDEQAARYPDVMLVCGKLDPEATHVEHAEVIVEVLSPSTRRTVTRAPSSLNIARRSTFTVDRAVVIRRTARSPLL